MSSPKSLLRVTFVILVISTLLSLVTGVASAQVDTGTILGTVTDQSGGVVAGASVTLTNQGTDLELTTVTSNTGDYIFTPIKIGTYKVTVSKSGFRTFSHINIVVNVQAQVKVDFALEPGVVTETVEVTAAAPLLQTQSATVGQTVGSRQITDLPLPSQNYTFLAQLAAGVTTVATGGGGRFNSTGGFVANGLPAPLNNYILDGIDNNNDEVDFLNGTAYVNLPPPDAIQEFKLQTSNFSAEFGRAGGAVVNAAIKSGTNDFHGDVWEYLRNDKLDANGFFANALGQEKGELRRNEFGGALGGPILRNKTFFFGDYNGIRIRQASLHTPTVPTAAEAASGFANFQDLLATNPSSSSDLLGRTFLNETIFDPATTRPVVCGAADPVTGLVGTCPKGAAPGTSVGYVRDPFSFNSGSGNNLYGTPGCPFAMSDFTSAAAISACSLNSINPNRLDPNAIKLLQLYPTPNAFNPGIKAVQFMNTYAVNRSQPDDTNHFDIRIDQNFSSKDQLFGAVSYTKRHAFFPGDFVGLASNAGFGAGNFDDLSINSAISETHVSSSTMINEFRIGYSRLHTISNPILVNQPGIPAQFGIQGVSQSNGNYGLPDIHSDGLTDLGAGAFASPNTRISNTVQLSENLTKIYGKHNFKGGFEFQTVRFPWTDPAWSRGQLNFGGYTGIPSVTGGVGMADMLLTPIAATVPTGINDVGGPNRVFASNITAIDDIRHYYASYFQDDWKLTPKLTLNLGLRWEFFGQVRETAGADAVLYPGAPNGAGAEYVINSASKNVPLSPSFTSLLATDGIKLAYSSIPGLTNTPLTDFAPRTGLAWQATRKAVVRLGYGIFFGGFQALGGAPDPGYNYPFAVNLSFFRPNDTSPITFPGGQNATLETSLINANPNPASPNFNAEGLGLTGFQYPWKTGYTQEWNAAFEYQFTPNQSITLQYIGNTSRHLLNGDKRNVTTEILPPGTACCKSYIPFPDFGYNSDYVAANGDAHYHAFQATFERRFSEGLQALVNYTRSECMTDARNILNSFGDNIFARAPLLPGFGLKADYRHCGSDVPNIFHASGIWGVPYGKGRRFANNLGGPLNQILGGWDVVGIFTAQNGFPFSVGCDPGTTANFNCYANLVPGMGPYANQGPHGIVHFMNIAAFAEPPAATAIGQTDYSPLGSKPDLFHGPTFSELDFSLLKQFQTTERTHLEFRGEFFNLLNHPSFNNPSSLDIKNPSNFGVITGTRGIARQVELGLKFYY